MSDTLSEIHRTNPVSTAIDEPGLESRTSVVPPSNGRVTRLDRWLVNRLFRFVGNPPVTVCLWDGKAADTPQETPVASLVIRDRGTLVKLLLDTDIQFGEGYSAGRIEVEGDLVRFCEAIFQSLPPAPTSLSFWQKLHLRGKNTLSRSRRNIHHHYDLGNDFYTRWLDDQLLYTCAYFAPRDATLEAAQIAKMDHVCRKVGLKPGQDVVELGCGWGALALHMARKYGARVRAYNISHEQILYARERAVKEGLGDRVEFIEDDWRNITGSYDAFVSVGMLEHVGLDNYQRLGNLIHRSLKKQGLALIHTIGRNVPQPLDPWIEKHTFPGAYPPSLKQMMDIFEGRNFSVLDVENLRLHYAETLRHWLRRFESHLDLFREMYDDSFVRGWRLYLAASVAAFTTGSLQLFQIVFAHPDNNDIPWTREAMYLPQETNEIATDFT